MNKIPKGYRSLEGPSPAEDHVGPFYYRKTEQGLKLGFAAAPEHCNVISTVHGGVLMCFADYAVTMLALHGVKGEACATVSFNADFVSGAKLGEWVEGRGEVVRRSGSMTFVRGELVVADKLIMTFQAVMRRLKKAG
ncbi:MAG: PaaI family thioesterase [Halieaceae bacterium]|nr:PaaI family thioesterase [Halieaceae bacterium]